MIDVGRALSDVVQQQRQIEKFGALEFAEKFGVALVPLGL